MPTQKKVVERSRKLWVSLKPAVVQELDDLSDEVGISRAALLSIVVHLGLGAYKRQNHPEQMITPDLLRSMLDVAKDRGLEIDVDAIQAALQSANK